MKYNSLSIKITGFVVVLLCERSQSIFAAACAGHKGFGPSHGNSHLHLDHGQEQGDVNVGDGRREHVRVNPIQ